MTRRHGIVVIMGVIARLSAPAVGVAAEEPPRSTVAAAALTKLLDERKLEATAVRDRSDPTRFISALYLPGSQLLVISARYPVPAALEQRIAEGQFRDAYLDLNGAGIREGRFFVMDLQADGLRRDPDRNQPFDIIYKNGVVQATYDGDWKAQKLTETDYLERFAADDVEYARMLIALVDGLRSDTSAAAVKRRP